MHLVALTVLQLLVMVGVPIAAVWWARRRLGVPGSVVVVGALTFVASQLVHIPLNYLLTWLTNLPGMPVPPKSIVPIVNALMLGFTAGLCEEWARYIAFRAVLKTRRAREHGLVFGLSHGGIESILLAGMVGAGALSMVLLRYGDPGALGVPPEQLDAARTAVEQWFAMEWYLPLLAALERVMAMILHVGATLLVLYGVATRRLWPVFAAMGWHWLADAVVVWVVSEVGAVASEIALFVLALGSAAIAVAVWRAFPRPASAPA